MLTCESSVTGQLASQALATPYAPNGAYGAPTSYVYPSGLNVEYGFNPRLQTCQVEHGIPLGGQPQTPLEEDVYWASSPTLCQISSNNNGTVHGVPNWNGGTPGPRHLEKIRHRANCR